MRKCVYSAIAVGYALMIAPVLADPAKSTIPQVLIEDLQTDLGLEDFQAAAIAGNLAQETGNFTILEQVKGPGLGYSQWTGSRKSGFRRYAGENVMSYEANYGFLVHELTGEYRYVLREIKATRSTEQAADLFMRKFLRPNPKHAALKKRVRFASNYLSGRFEGSGCRSSVHIGGGRLVSC